MCKARPLPVRRVRAAGCRPLAPCRQRRAPALLPPTRGRGARHFVPDGAETHSRRNH